MIILKVMVKSLEVSQITMKKYVAVIFPAFRISGDEVDMVI